MRIGGKRRKKKRMERGRGCDLKLRPSVSNEPYSRQEAAGSIYSLLLTILFPVVATEEITTRFPRLPSGSFLHPCRLQSIATVPCCDVDRILSAALSPQCFRLGDVDLFRSLLLSKHKPNSFFLPLAFCFRLEFPSKLPTQPHKRGARGAGGSISHFLPIGLKTFTVDIDTYPPQIPTKATISRPRLCN